MRYRHKKRGTIYEHVGVAEVQTGNRIYEGDKLQVYRGEDGRLWARPMAEFHDGRFEPVTDYIGPNQMLIDGKVELRPMPDGSFDELVLYDAPGGNVIVHAEMMDDGCLWIGLTPPGETERRAVMWINIKDRKLHVTAQED